VRFQDAAPDARHVVYAGIQADPLVARAAGLLAEATTGERLMADPIHIRGEYLRQREAFQSAFKRRAQDLNVEYIPVNTDVPFEVLLGNFLRRRAAMKG